MAPFGVHLSPQRGNNRAVHRRQIGHGPDLDPATNIRRKRQRHHYNWRFFHSISLCDRYWAHRAQSDRHQAKCSIISCTYSVQTLELPECRITRPLVANWLSGQLFVRVKDCRGRAFGEEAYRGQAFDVLTYEKARHEGGPMSNQGRRFWAESAFSILRSGGGLGIVPFNPPIDNFGCQLRIPPDGGDEKLLQFTLAGLRIFFRQLLEHILQPVICLLSF